MSLSSRSLTSRTVVRRLLAPIIGVVAASTVAVVPVAPASAATVFSGRVVDSWNGTALAGVTVVVAEIDGTPVPGASGVTAADGSFSIAGLDGEEYAVQVDARAQGYERGWVGSPNGQPFGKPVLQGLEEAITWAPQALGSIGVDGRTYSGRVVDADTGSSLAGVRVSATDTNGVVIAGTSVLTDAFGRFRIGGDLGEEQGIRVDGNAVGRERGWLGMVPAQPFGKPVVPAWGDAVTWAPAKLGTIGLDEMTAPFAPTRVSLTSQAVGSLTLTARASSDGDRTASFEVRCVARITAVTRIYPRSGATRTGFRSGPNSCRVRAVNPAGVSNWVAVNTTVL